MGLSHYFSLISNVLPTPLTACNAERHTCLFEFFGCMYVLSLLTGFFLLVPGIWYWRYVVGNQLYVSQDGFCSTTWEKDCCPFSNKQRETYSPFTYSNNNITTNGQRQASRSGIPLLVNYIHTDSTHPSLSHESTVLTYALHLWFLFVFTLHYTTPWNDHRTLGMTSHELKIISFFFYTTLHIFNRGDGRNSSTLHYISIFTFCGSNVSISLVYVSDIQPIPRIPHSFSFTGFKLDLDFKTQIEKRKTNHTKIYISIYTTYSPFN